VGLTDPGQMSAPRETYLSTRRSALHASVASFLCNMLKGVLAVILALIDFAKVVVSGPADLTLWLV